MTYTATITSKRQLTIPIALFEAAKLKEGEKVLIKLDGEKIEIEKMETLVKRTAGLIRVPKRLLSINIDEAIEIAKKKRFSKI